MLDLEEAKRQLAKTRSPEARLRLLLEKSYEFYRTAPKDAEQWAREALTLAKKLKEKEAIARAHYRIGCTLFQLCNYPAATKEFTTAIELDKNGALLESPIFSLGLALAQQGKYREAIEYYHRALAISREHKSKTEIDILGALGNAALEQGDYPKALEYQYQSLALIEDKNDLLRRSVILLNIGRIYFDVEDYVKADNFFTQASTIKKEIGDTAGLISAIYNRAILANRNDNLALAKQLLDEAYSLASSIHREESLAYIENTLGEIELDAGNPKRAIRHFDRAQELASAIELQIVLTAALVGKGRSLLELSKIEQGIAVLQEAFQISRDSGILTQECNCSSLLAKAFEKAGDLKTSIGFYNHFIELNSEVHARQKQRALVEISARVEIEKADRERARMEQLAKDANERAELLRKETERQSQELTTLALELVERNEFLCNLKNEIEPAVKSSRKAKSLLEKIDNHVKSDRDWETFEHQFNQVHRDFLKQLSSSYPALTPTELKIAVLIKLDLPTKSIANLLCLSQRTVENHRQAIRRKLKLKGEDNLVSFLIAFGETNEAR